MFKKKKLVGCQNGQIVQWEGQSKPITVYIKYTSRTHPNRRLIDYKRLEILSELYQKSG